jgi:hypothetical protein
MPINKKRVPQWRVVSSLVNSEDVKMHRSSVYEWEGILFEVLGKEEIKKKDIASSHFVPVFMEGKEWRIRQAKEKSKLYKEIKK